MSLADPVFRRERARRAGRVAQANRRRRAAQEAAKFPSKAKAYAAGYRTGYSAAMRWWKYQVSKGRVAA